MPDFGIKYFNSRLERISCLPKLPIRVQWLIEIRFATSKETLPEKETSHLRRQFLVLEFPLSGVGNFFPARSTLCLSERTGSPFLRLRLFALPDFLLGYFISSGSFGDLISGRGSLRPRTRNGFGRMADRLLRSRRSRDSRFPFLLSKEAKKAPIQIQSFFASARRKDRKNSL